MVLLNNLFSRKPDAKSASQTQEPELADAGPTNLPAQDEQALARKNQRLERRELLYTVVRESMARVGLLSSSYKYKVLSLDSRGSQYLIMMDLPADLAGQIDHLNEIEEILSHNARQRHNIEVTGVYWRINPQGKNAVLRKTRGSEEVTRPQQATEPSTPMSPGQTGRGQRYEPIRPEEVNAFRHAVSKGTSKPSEQATSLKRPAVQGNRPTTPSAPAYKPSEFPATEFEETQMIEEDKMPLSRTQYGDLI